MAKKRKTRKRRTAAQIAATKKLVRLNKKRAAKKRRKPRKKRRTPAQKAATRKLVAYNKRRHRKPKAAPRRAVRVKRAAPKKRRKTAKRKLTAEHKARMQAGRAAARALKAAYGPSVTRQIPGLAAVLAAAKARSLARGPEQLSLFPNPRKKKRKTAARAWWIADLHTGTRLTTYIDKCTRAEATAGAKDLMHKHRASSVELSGPYTKRPSPYDPRR